MAQYQITELDWDDWPPSHRMHIAILDGTVREVNKKTGLNTKSTVGEECTTLVYFLLLKHSMYK